MRRRSLLPLVVMTAVLLSGCSSPGGHPKAQTYRTLDDLKSAYISSGSACPKWQEDDDIQSAAQSGTCGNGVTLSTYLNIADLLGEVKLLRDTAFSGDDASTDPPKTELLIGANWLISGEHVRGLQPKLGGQLAVINPAASN